MGTKRRARHLATLTRKAYTHHHQNKPLQRTKKKKTLEEDKSIDDGDV